MLTFSCLRCGTPEISLEMELLDLKESHVISTIPAAIQAYQEQMSALNSALTFFAQHIDDYEGNSPALNQIPVDFIVERCEALTLALNNLIEKRNDLVIKLESEPLKKKIENEVQGRLAKMLQFLDAMTRLKKAPAYRLFRQPAGPGLHRLLAGRESYEALSKQFPLFEQQINRWGEENCHHREIVTEIITLRNLIKERLKEERLMPWTRKIW